MTRIIEPPPPSDPPVTPDGAPLLMAGGLVALGPLRRDLLERYQRWINDPAVMPGVGRPMPLTFEEEAAWYDQVAHDPSAALFTVYDRKDLAPVGTTGLTMIDHLGGTASFGIMLGERHGRGLGTDTTRLVVRWGFAVLGLHNILLKVFAWNEPALRAYRSAGFRELGRRRDAAFTKGGRGDVVYMDVVPADLAGP